jgi:glycosyltransferase involved in cell wall biosynthesis
MAIPVVTTDVPSCRETVIDRINGRLPDAVARMGAASRERVLARFSAYRVNARILGVLRECLK